MKSSRLQQFILSSRNDGIHLEKNAITNHKQIDIVGKTEADVTIAVEMKMHFLIFFNIDEIAKKK